MWTDKALFKLSNKNTYNREDLFRIFRKEKPDLTDSAFRWTLYNLQQKQELFRVSHDSYATSRPELLPEYHPYYSDKAKSIIELLSNNINELKFVAFESVLLNEFLNHQIAQNTIYVQVEKDLSAYIFDRLQDEYPGNVLYKPRKDEFDRYWTRDCIVVLDLVSQSPVSSEFSHEILIEKLLVDIVAEKSIAATFSPAELPYIFENAVGSYQIDKRRLNRYAGRRSKAKLVMKYAEQGK